MPGAEGGGGELVFDGNRASAWGDEEAMGVMLAHSGHVLNATEQYT